MQEYSKCRALPCSASDFFHEYVTRYWICSSFVHARNLSPRCLDFKFNKYQKFATLLNTNSFKVRITQLSDSSEQSELAPSLFHNHSPDCQRPSTRTQVLGTGQQFRQTRSKFILAFENNFCMNQKKCCIPENVNLRDALLYRALAESPFGRLFHRISLCSHSVTLCKSSQEWSGWS